MLRLLERLSSAYSPRHYVVADTDEFSAQKIHSFEQSRAERDPTATASAYYIHRIPRSREVRQSWLSTVFTTLRSAWLSFPLTYRVKPDLVGAVQRARHVRPRLRLRPAPGAAGCEAGAARLRGERLPRGAPVPVREDPPPLLRLLRGAVANSEGEIPYVRVPGAGRLTARRAPCSPASPPLTALGEPRVRRAGARDPGVRGRVREPREVAESSYERGANKPLCSHTSGYRLSFLHRRTYRCLQGIF
ncbi:UDP-N-acetylglucosamine transferase subunit ALG14 homolog isoform X2 [Pteronotus mesoamericanus]|nr:UDP-N-acetylglucosamine transferase subunit ALG14 homolog isoform X2 [Pteronotus parnellii mesoamericanus]XP_054421061.1 UDP-N-acetylglucosamine transferase subunit ALG14 homolog isoform X2 [Pteronotus parnellii mesoamericanus]XP_054421062.1 UDP-N-acetylglucosamine transferase subunit ALG14 homolog isoform X2 [Pteronotus parnellii mesoamericanus]